MNSVSPVVYSFYRGNIPASVISSQKAVFDHFDIPLRQQRNDKLTHGKWVDDIFTHGTDDIVIIADIDAFPLSRAAYEALCAIAEEGAVVGLAQVANHKDPDRIYAGPMFMAVRRDVYERLGRPGMERTPKSDVAQLLTDHAHQHGIPVHLIPPRFAIQSKWPLAGQGVFGIGTFYGEMEFFHLFQSHKRRTVELFNAVARDTIAGRFDFASYLDIMERRKFLGLF